MIRPLGLVLICLLLCNLSCAQPKPSPPLHADGFDPAFDLLLLHYDCKTDVDDLLSVAAAATLLAHPDFKNIRYHAVAGAYGEQGGLYVPPNSLFELAFQDHWSDAHGNLKQAIREVQLLATSTIAFQGEVWIADAGQSDFSSYLIRAMQDNLKELYPSDKVHVIQHSDWNQKVTAPENLAFVRDNADYQKIPDGNALGNGTPGFRSPEAIDLASYISDPHLRAVWEQALQLCQQYNGHEGRYLNQAIADGGLDFSDFSEVCWILKLEGIEDSKDFFRKYGKE